MNLPHSPHPPRPARRQPTHRQHTPSFTPWLLTAAVASVLCAPAALQAQERVLLPPNLPIHTRFAEEVSARAPRPEYPRPQLVRADWLSLNGQWDFSTRVSGDYESRILVPFACESALSGLMKGQQIVEHVRYRRTFVVPEAWRSQNVLLHFEAVDWAARVIVNGRELGSHRGGYDRFSVDVTDALTPRGPQVIEVHVHDPADPSKDGIQPRGKQLGSHGIWYTRTTGIWQSVWCEPVPSAHVRALALETKADGALRVAATLEDAPPTAVLRVEVAGVGRDGRPVLTRAEGPATAPLALQVAGIRPWSPADPALYDVTVSLRDGERTVDAVQSYVGFRSVAIRDGRYLLNGEPIFLRGVLDQGYWPEGGMTAPSDEALRYDVELALQLGFNLARKHVKVEDARWYYWCDRLGLMVMQDMPSSQNLASDGARGNFLAELDAMLLKVGNHPCVIHWVAFNEDWGRPGAFQEAAVQHLRGRDASRPVTDASGWHQRADTDVTDVHDYGGDLLRHGVSGDSRAVIVGECGGIAFSDQAHVWSSGWGYATAESGAVLLERINRIVRQAFDAKSLQGYVWTQLTDVEQELNGLVHYDRTPKVDAAHLARIVRGLVPLPPRLEVDRWLVLGPIAAEGGIEDAVDSPANREQLARMLRAAQLAGEATLAPVAGSAVNVNGSATKWEAVTPTGATIDLRALHGGDPRNCVSYAVAALEVAAPRTAQLLFGSDDGARVWLNGKLVHEAVAVRGVAAAQDRVPVQLVAGRNTIVVKVAQGAYGFGFDLFFEVGD